MLQPSYTSRQCHTVLNMTRIHFGQEVSGTTVVIVVFKETQEDGVEATHL